MAKKNGAAAETKIVESAEVVTKKADEEVSSAPEKKSDVPETKIDAVVTEQKKVRCYAIKDHECTIGKDSNGVPNIIRLTKDEYYNLDFSSAVILQNAGIVLRK